MRNLFSLLLFLILFAACAQDTDEKQAASSTEVIQQGQNNTESETKAQTTKPKVENLKLYGKFEYLETGDCPSTPHLSNTSKEPLFFTVAWQKENGSFGFLQERCIYPQSTIAFSEKCIGRDVKSVSIKDARRPNKNEKVLNCE